MPLRVESTCLSYLASPKRYAQKRRPKNAGGATLVLTYVATLPHRKADRLHAVPLSHVDNQSTHVDNLSTHVSKPEGKEKKGRKEPRARYFPETTLPRRDATRALKSDESSTPALKKKSASPYKNKPRAGAKPETPQQQLDATPPGIPAHTEHRELPPSSKAGRSVATWT